MISSFRNRCIVCCVWLGRNCQSVWFCCSLVLWLCVWGVLLCVCFVSWIRLFVLVGLVVNHGEQGGIGKQFEFVEDVCLRSAASSQTLSFASELLGFLSWPLRDRKVSYSFFFRFFVFFPWSFRLKKSAIGLESSCIKAFQDGADGVKSFWGRNTTPNSWYVDIILLWNLFR
jgi:hypothetical protein